MTSDMIMTSDMTMTSDYDSDGALRSFVHVLHEVNKLRVDAKMIQYFP